jgi:hypothetical protein
MQRSSDAFSRKSKNNHGGNYQVAAANPPADGRWVVLKLSRLLGSHGGKTDGPAFAGPSIVTRDDCFQLAATAAPG